MKINTPQKIRLPELRGVQDVTTQNVINQIMLLLDDTFRAVYRDIVNLSVTRADALPTAGIDYLGKFYLISHVGAVDTLHICRWNDATLAYSWAAVTLT